MREFVFTAEYEPGTDDIMDIFIDYSGLEGKALRVAVSNSGLWRVDRFIGPPDGLAALEEVMTDPAICNECLGDYPDCSIDTEYEVIRENHESLLVYAYSPTNGYCHSIPYLVSQTVGEGPLFDARRCGNRYEWRVLLPGDTDCGTVFDRLQNGLPKGVSISLTQVGTPSSWPTANTSIKTLSYNQRQAIETAVDLGYYGTPRGASLGEVATALDLPKSTLRYRLRGAEKWLVETIFDAEEAVSGDTEP
jgi:HTH DNA binding domain